MKKMLFLFLVLLAACAPALPSAAPAMPRYLALGDSYTIGEGVDSSNTYPAQLVQAVGLEGILLDYQVIARTGWTTEELMQGVEKRDPQGPYDLVTLLVGANDQFRGYPLQEYRDQFRSMLQMAVRLAGERAESVVVISIPDWGISPAGSGYNRAGVGAEIDQFNEINRQEAEAAGARYVDITARGRELGGDWKLYASDGLHPSGAQYAAWVELILPVVLEALGGN